MAQIGLDVAPRALMAQPRVSIKKKIIIIKCFIIKNKEKAV